MGEVDVSLPSNSAEQLDNYTELFYMSPAAGEIQTWIVCSGGW